MGRDRLLNIAIIPNGEGFLEIANASGMAIITIRACIEISVIFLLKGEGKRSFLLCHPQKGGEIRGSKGT
jgi:hypothetical protein